MKLPSGMIFTFAPIKKGTAVEISQQELITCADCKHDAYTSDCQDVLCMKTGARMTKNDYCSYAERI